MAEFKLKCRGQVEAAVRQVNMKPKERERERNAGHFRLERQRYSSSSREGQGREGREPAVYQGHPGWHPQGQLQLPALPLLALLDQVALSGLRVPFPGLALFLTPPEAGVGGIVTSTRQVEVVLYVTEY